MMGTRETQDKATPRVAVYGRLSVARIRYDFCVNVANLLQIPFLVHFHPAVIVSASDLLSVNRGPSKPDIGNQSLMRFLDKFAYRHPRSVTTGHGTSIMQSAGSPGDAWLARTKGAGARTSDTTINSASFRKKNVEDIAGEDVFFHEYFKQSGRKGQDDRQSWADSTTDRGREADIWKALVESEIQDDVEDIRSLDGSRGESMSDITWSDFSDDSFMGDSENEIRANRQTGNFEPDSASDVDILIDAGSEMPAGMDLRKFGPKSNGKSKRKALRDLPAFASAEDYSQLLDEDDEN
jgi:ribosome biogenesis protein MAK21